MKRERTKRTKAGKELLPCISCGVPFLQYAYRKRRPCGKEKCLVIQAQRRGEFDAAEDERRRSEYKPKASLEACGSTENLLRHGGDAVVESADGSVTVSIADKDLETAIESGDVKKKSGKSGGKAQAGQKLALILEEPVVSAIVNPTNPDAPYGFDLESDLPIKPPMMGIVLPGQRLPVQPRCSVHENYPAPPSCFKCQEDARLTKTRERNPSRGRQPLEIPIEPTQIDPEKKMLNDAKLFFGIPLRSPQSVPFRVPTPLSESEHQYKYGIPFRKRLGLTREHIAAWLQIPDVLLGIRLAVREKYEADKAVQISEIKDRIADYERELEDLEKRREISGLDGRTIAALRRKFMKSKQIARDELTQMNRKKFPKSLGRPLKAESVECYLKHSVKLSDTEDDDLIFENQVISNAIEAGVFQIPVGTRISRLNIAGNDSPRSEAHAKPTADQDVEEITVNGPDAPEFDPADDTN